MDLRQSSRLVKAQHNGPTAPWLSKASLGQSVARNGSLGRGVPSYQFVKYQFPGGKHCCLKDTATDWPSDLPSVPLTWFCDSLPIESSFPGVGGRQSSFVLSCTPTNRLSRELQCVPIQISSL